MKNKYILFFTLAAWLGFSTGALADDLGDLDITMEIVGEEVRSTGEITNTIDIPMILQSMEKERVQTQSQNEIKTQARENIQDNQDMGRDQQDAIADIRESASTEDIIEDLTEDLLEQPQVQETLSDATEDVRDDFSTNSSTNSNNHPSKGK